jgi:predicted amidophosphoribosyltransferase
MLRSIVSLLAPPLCAACAGHCDAGAMLCERCTGALRRAGPLLGDPPRGAAAAWAATAYDGVGRELVAALKFRRLRPVAGELAARIAAAAPPRLLRGALVPVPPAPRRLRGRGFDPAAEIAAALAAIAGLELRPCLARANGPRQVGRPRGERTASPPRPWLARPAPPRAILVDDVLTTGATLAACAAVLRRGGAEHVVALTFARAL